MLYTLVASDPQLFHKVRNCLPPTEQIITTHQWSSQDITCWRSGAVIVAGNLNLAMATERISVIKQTAPLKIAIVTSSTRQHGSAPIFSSYPDAILPVEKIEKELWGSIRRVRVRQRLDQLAIACDSTEHLTLSLRKVFLCLFTCNLPISSVEDLAIKVACNRRTLWYHWSKSTASSADLRLSDFIDLVLLFHATSRKSNFTTWDTIAHELNVHVDTLTRLCRRLMGCTLGNMPANGEDAVWIVLKQSVSKILQQSLLWTICIQFVHFAY